MNVIINKRPSDKRIQIKFDGWKNNRGRYTRIELDIIKKINWITCDPISAGDNVMLLTRDIRLADFSVIDIDHIKTILKGYMIDPEIEV